MIRWTVSQKFFFILDYAWGKLAILWTVKSPKWPLFFYEVHYSLRNLLNAFRRTNLSPLLYNGPTSLKLSTGNFEVRPASHDAALVSPGFETADFRKLFHLIRALRARGRDVWFVDIGANIGAFSVRVAKKFPEVKVWSVEPAPDNLRLLNRNLQLNGAQSTVLAMAASAVNGEGFLDFSTAQGGDTRLSSKGTRVELKRLDQVLPLPSALTTLIFKIDVEGHEIPALEGLTEILDASNESWLCVEDMFERSKLEAQLSKMGFRYRQKVTPYNSWWSRIP